MDFSAWNAAIDAEKFKKELAELKERSKEHEEVPPGEYVVKIEKMELRESKAGNPMVSMQFRIMEGDRAKQCIFYNQTIKEPFQIHLANQFLNSLHDSKIKVEFDGNYENYNNAILGLHEKCEKLEYTLVLGKNQKGYNTYRIKEIWE